MTQSPNPDFRLPDGRLLFMSYGMLNRLSIIVEKPESLPLVYLDPHLQATVVSNLLGTYDAEAKQFKPVDPDTIELTPLVVADLLAWISEHLLDFFVQTLQRTQGLEGKFNKLKEGLVPSSDGSKG